MARVPRLTAGFDFKSLKLSPAEGFLLSRIDATSSERDLSLATGLPPDSVARSLDRLFQLGAIDFGEGSRPPPGRTTAPAAGPGGSVRPPPNGAGSGAPAVRTNPFESDVPRYDPAELLEAVDLDDEKKKRILNAFYQLEELNHYEILGVDRTAEKKAIKGAYYQLAPEFHPDKYFRKNLGAFKPKIEAIFARITLAHDVLTSKERRLEYDEYVDLTSKNKAADEVIDRSAADLASVQAAIAEAAKARAGVSSPPPAQSMPPPMQPSAPPPRPVESPEAMQARRETLARKLGAGLRPRTVTPPPASTPPAVDSAIASKAAAEALRARYEAALVEAKRAQLQRYLVLGRQSIERKDYANAVNAYQIAVALAPDDAEVQGEASTALLDAASNLADSYLKAAAFEVSMDKWAEAAQSYAKAARGRPDDARTHERLAFATLKSGGNPRKAIEAARRAVELQPRNAEARVTLARSYYLAGFEKSGDGELERAKELGEKDARIKELIDQTKSFVKDVTQKSQAPQSAAKPGSSPK